MKEYPKLFSNNLASIVRYSELNNAAFERKLGWSNGYLDKALKSGNMSTDKVLQLFQKFPEIDITWFFTGRGEMLKNEDNFNNSTTNLSSQSPDILQLLEIIEQKLPYDASLVSRLKTKIIEIVKELADQKEKVIQLHESREIVG